MPIAILQKNECHFHDIAYEGLEIGIKASTAEHNSFIGGGFEPRGVHKGIDLDPVTCVGNKFIGLTMFEEQMFVPGRLGSIHLMNGTSIRISQFPR